MSKKQSRKMTPQKKQRVPIWLWLIVAAGVALIAFVVFDNVPRSNNTPSAVPQATGAPKLQADKEKVDLGKVKLGQTVSVSFEITNLGNQPLRFSEAPFIEVAAGC